MRVLSASLVLVCAAGCASDLPTSPLGFSGVETNSAAPQLAQAATPEPAAVAASITDRLADLCAPENGYAQGAAGAKNEGLCTGEYAAGFDAAYAAGAALFAARVDVEQVKAEISAAQRELWALRRNISLSQSGFSALSGRIGDRRAVRDEAQGLAAEDARLSAGIAALQAALARAEADIRRREAAGYVGGAVIHSAQSAETAAEPAATVSAAPVSATPAAY